jgi:hypothetical protein
VDAYEAERRVEVADVLDRFERVNAECQPGGPRFAHYLTFFSGKDLLLAMEPGLATLSLGTPRDSCSRVASCIEVAADDVALWLPEWSALRNELAQAHSKDGPSAGGV